MRESENSEGVLRRYESPAMRVVPTDGGRIVVESQVSFTGDTSLGAFGDGGGSFWNEALATDGSLGNFTPGDGSFWNEASATGGGLGGFTTGDDSFWNEASATGGGLGMFDPVVGQEWSGGETSTGGGIGGFGPGAGSALQWDASTTP